MWPLLQAALAAVEKNKEQQAQRSQNMQAAALGQPSQAAPQQGNALAGLGGALGGMLSKQAPAAPAAPTGGMSAETGQQVDDTLNSLDQFHSKRDQDLALLG